MYTQAHTHIHRHTLVSGYKLYYIVFWFLSNSAGQNCVKDYTSDTVFYLIYSWHREKKHLVNRCNLFNHFPQYDEILSLCCLDEKVRVSILYTLFKISDGGSSLSHFLVKAFFLVASTDNILKNYMSFFVHLQNSLSRNFYNLRFLALFISFALNFILLFYKVVNLFYFPISIFGPFGFLLSFYMSFCLNYQIFMTILNSF